MNPTDAMLAGAAKGLTEVLRRRHPNLAFDVRIRKGNDRVAGSRELRKSGIEEAHTLSRGTPALPDEHRRERAA